MDEAPTAYTERSIEVWPPEVARYLRERGREHQGQERTLRLSSLEPATLYAMGDEVVGVTLTPRGLRRRASRHLTRRGRTRTLAMADTPIGDKPAPADPTGTLREHPHMLAPSAPRQGWSTFGE